MEESFLFQVFVRNADGKPTMNGIEFLCRGIVNGEIQVRSLQRQVLVDIGVLESEAEEFLPAPADNLRVEWTEEETHCLLQKYLEYIAEIGPMKKFRSKKAMWQRVSEDLSQIGSYKSSLQCANRYKTLQKRKKGAIDSNRTTGNTRTPVEFEQELGKIASLDDSIEPEVRRGVCNVTYKETGSITEAGPSQAIPHPSKSSDEEPERKRAKYTTVQSLLRELSKEKEEANRKKEERKDQRHKERLEIEREKFELLKSLLEKKA